MGLRSRNVIARATSRTLRCRSVLQGMDGRDRRMIKSAQEVQVDTNAFEILKRYQFSILHSETPRS